jgi:LPXTG-motif cell wall-anchored protein
MRQHQSVIAIATGLMLALVGATTVVAAQGQTLTLQLTSQNNSGVSGTAVFTQTGSNVHIEIKVNGAGAGPQPAHIHEGTCAQLNPTPQYSLLNVTNGTSTTDVPTTIQALTASPHAIHMHKSADELSVYVACADIVPASLPRTGDADSAPGLIGLVSGLTLLGFGLIVRARARRRSA